MKKLTCATESNFHHTRGWGPFSKNASGCYGKLSVAIFVSGQTFLELKLLLLFSRFVPLGIPRLKVEALAERGWEKGREKFWHNVWEWVRRLHSGIPTDINYF